MTLYNVRCSSSGASKDGSEDASQAGNSAQRTRLEGTIRRKSAAVEAMLKDMGDEVIQVCLGH
jgi:hypothetical protein